MIVVFGSVNLDLVARVERLPRPGETLSGSSFAMLPGGKGANQALAARRAGADVTLVAAVGDDAFAAPATALLRADGVVVATVRCAGTPTGVALIHVDAAGENAITVVPGANGRLDAAALGDDVLVAGATLLLQLEVPMPAVAAAAARGRARGARVILNAAPIAPLGDGLLDALDVLIVNEHEARALAGALGVATEPERFATAVHRRCRAAVVVTLGGRGALAAADGRLLAVAAPSIEVVDTTGAGDAFCGGLAAALDAGANWRRALATGIAAGALACTGIGAQPALPRQAAIAALAADVLPTIVTTPLG